MATKLYAGDWIEVLRDLPAESVQCVVTSPPYWGLRDYNTEGQLGLEASPDEYLVKMVAGFREVRRVLRPDGVAFVNLGDCYATKPFYDGATIDPKWKQARNRGRNNGPNRKPLEGIKPKDMVGVPWMVAFALRADGWYLRQDIIWAKSNPMPESVTDRCTKGHEYIFLLSKSERYFFDAFAIREEVSGTSHERGDGVNPKARKHGQHSRMQEDRDPRHLQQSNGVGWGYTDLAPKPRTKRDGRRPKAWDNDMGSNRTLVAGYGRPEPRPKQNESFSAAVNQLVTHRNKRSVWEIATAPYREAHFATFPPKIPEQCILSGTSEVGACPKCGSPWKRVVLPSEAYAEKLGRARVNGYDYDEDLYTGMRVNEKVNSDYRSAGWYPTCECGGYKVETIPAWRSEWHKAHWLSRVIKKFGPAVPCVVLDPFNGAGTTGLVAARLNRDYIGIELSSEYLTMAERRLYEDRPLLADVEVICKSTPKSLGEVSSAMD